MFFLRQSEVAVSLFIQDVYELFHIYRYRSFISLSSSSDNNTNIYREKFNFTARLWGWLCSRLVYQTMKMITWPNAIDLNCRQQRHVMWLYCGFRSIALRHITVQVPVWIRFKFATRIFINYFFFASIYHDPVFVVILFALVTDWWSQ